MIRFAAFAIMMAVGNMNAFAAQKGAGHNVYNMNGRGVVVAYHGDHRDAHAVRKMSRHERKMMERARRREELRRLEEARRMEEMRRREAHRRHVARCHEVVVVNNNVAAGVAAGVTVAALIAALAK